MKKKHIITICIALLVVAGILLIVSYSSKKVINTGNITTTQITEWKTYTSDKGGYSVSYPSNFLILSSNETSVAFSDAQNDPWSISVRVSTTTFATAEQWIADQDKKYKTTTIIEKHVTIDRNDAIITYQKNTTETYPNEKRTIFIRSGKVYEIGTRYNVDEQKVWDSFRITQ